MLAPPAVLIPEGAHILNTSSLARELRITISQQSDGGDNMKANRQARDGRISMSPIDRRRPK